MGLMALFSAGLLATGCQPPAIDLDNLEPPQVTVAKPLPRMVVDTEEFTAKTDSVHSVEVRARVSGYLTKIFFQEGTEVKKDDPLFLIDPRPYDMTLKRDQAQVAMLEARLIRANADLQRAKDLLPQKAVAGTDFDRAVADAAEAKASLDSAKADLERAKLDVEFTKIHAPIDGQISRTQITVGNLVNSDSTLLTTIVSIDPVYAYFDVAENIFERIQQRYREGKLKVTDEKEIPVWLGLSVETGFPHEGTINFAENRVDPNTGTLRLRGVFPNPKPKAGGRVLMPGMFARVCIPVAPQRPLLLVPEEALGTDQGQKFVYVVNAKNEVEYRHVTPGKQEAGLRAIEEGLHADDQVIVRGMQRARPGIVVKPKFETDVPGDAKPAANAKPAADAKPAAQAKPTGESHPAAKQPAKAH
jgi:multidrug efflux system membrane fusion protein